MIEARITLRGSVVYDCVCCGRRHFHGGEWLRVGDVTHRASHCDLLRGEDVELLIVADERTELAPLVDVAAGKSG